MKNRENEKIKLMIRQSIAGSIAGILFLMGNAAILSTLILNGSVPERNIHYFVLGIIVLSVLLGTSIARKNAGESKRLVCIFTGIAIFCILLLLTAVLFGGQYTGVGETGLLILCGSLLPILMNRGGQKKKKSSSRMVKLYKKPH